MIRTLLLLGATGDLAKRFLFPALGTLRAAGRLPGARPTLRSDAIVTAKTPGGSAR